MKLILPCLLGLERAIADELALLSYPKDRIILKDGQVSLLSEARDLTSLSRDAARLNLRLRSAERVMLELAEAPVTDYDSLFDLMFSLPWEKHWMPGYFIEIKFFSLKSELFGSKAAQSLGKKAIVKRLLRAHALPPDAYLEESKKRGRMRVRLAMRENRLSVRLDLSGDALYKRGYRTEAGDAPLRETLAAALLHYSRYEPFSSECLYDPFCGSGTIVIEAAMRAAGLAPGLLRDFAAEQLPWCDKKRFEEERTLCRAEADDEAPEDAFLFASDIDEAALRMAQANAERAGVASFIRFYRADVRNEASFSPVLRSSSPRCLIVTNPPYGERLSERAEVKCLHEALRKKLIKGSFIREPYRLSLITSDPELEADFGLRADKRRKLYNGMLETTMYHYFRHEKTGSGRIREPGTRPSSGGISSPRVERRNAKENR